MGSRANIFVVRDGVTRIFYTHWGGQGLHEELFWGPEHGLAFASSQKEVGQAGILDNVWAEGGAVIDVDRRRLLLYSRFNFDYDLLLRRAHMKLLQPVWTDWQVGWATGEMFEFMDYLGLPRSLAANSYSRPEEKLSELHRNPLDTPWPEVESVCSIRFDSGETNLYPLSVDAGRAATEPDFILACSGSVLGQSDYGPQGWPDERLPENGGVHLDQAARRAFWWGFNAPDDQVRPVEGWTVEFVGDRYELQVDATRGQLKFPERAESELVSEVCNRLLRNAQDPADTVRAATGLLEFQGASVELNPMITAHTPLPLTRQERVRILRWVIEQLGMRDLPAALTT